jgi:hypothetical protein
MPPSVATNPAGVPKDGDDWRRSHRRGACFATAVDVAAAVIGTTSILASAGVALASIRTQRQLAADAVRTDRENELRSVIDKAALALQVGYQRLLAAVEAVDRPPRYDQADNADELQEIHEQKVAMSGRYWMRSLIDDLERALEELEVLQARLAVRLGNGDRLHGIVHNTRNVLTAYGSRPLRELGAGAAWTDSPFGESLREMTDTALQVGREAQPSFFQAASERVGVQAAF